MSKVQLADGVYWVGAIDWNIRNFHGYSTHLGTTYNAYLVIDEKTALIDTVKAPFYEGMLGRISEIVAPEDIDLNFHANFPVNYYMPLSGITVKWLMGEWKAMVVIYSKDNPNKKWLRFYWWVRDLRNILKYGQREIGEGTQMGWKLQKGVSSPNIHDKKMIKPLIKALKNIAKN